MLEYRYQSENRYQVNVRHKTRMRTVRVKQYQAIAGDIRQYQAISGSQTHIVQLGACAALLVGARVIVNYQAKLADTQCFLSRSHQGQAFQQVRWSEFETFRVIIDDFGESVDGLLVLFLGIGNLPQVKFGI